MAAHERGCRCSLCTDGGTITFEADAWRVSAPLAKDEPEYWAATGMPVGDSPDLQRILHKVPRRAPIDPYSPTGQAVVEMEMARYGLGDVACTCRTIEPNRFVDKTGAPRDGCIRRLFPMQAIMLRELRLARGLIAQASVGGGKAAVGILAPLALGVERSLMFVPASLVDQIEADYKLVAQHFRVPSIVIHKSASEEWRKIVPGMPLLHVLPYSLISTKKMSAWIDNLEPDAIIADECDSFSNLTSSRTIRLMRFFSGTPEMPREARLKRAQTIFCGWTGSLTDSKISEFAHLLAVALKYNSPLPLDPEEVENWGRFLDATDSPCPPGALRALCENGDAADNNDVYDAFHRRLVETLGFLSVQGAPILSKAGTVVENVIREREIEVIPDIVLRALEIARDFRRPDSLAPNDEFGEDEWLDDPLEQARVVRQVASGMYYRRIYPRGEPKSLIKRWLVAQKDWRKEVRGQMLRGLVHLDSPTLCEEAARRAWGDDRPIRGLPDWRAESWPAWREVCDLVKPGTEAVRLHPFLVDDAAKWALESPGIVWYTMKEFAEWLGEKTGLTVHEGGPGAGKRLMAENGKRSIIASVASHGRGRDRMQYAFSRQLLAQILASDRRFQQLFGRLDRAGQPETHVFTDVYLHVPEILKSFDQAKTRGRYVQRTTREERKLLKGWRDGT